MTRLWRKEDSKRVPRIQWSFEGIAVRKTIYVTDLRSLRGAFEAASLTFADTRGEARASLWLTRTCLTAEVIASEQQTKRWLEGMEHIRQGVSQRLTHERGRPGDEKAL